MEHYAGLDVSLATTAICIVDDKGNVVLEVTVSTDPEAIAAVIVPHGPSRVGLEAGPMSEWLHSGLARCGVEAVLMETRQVRAALKASFVKTDRRDARGIAQLLRMGWFRPVHAKTVSARERRVLLGARETLVRRTRDLDNSVRGSGSRTEANPHDSQQLPWQPPPDDRRRPADEPIDARELQSCTFVVTGR